jgi:hypothetical protein
MASMEQPSFNNNPLFSPQDQKGKGITKGMQKNATG